MKPDLMKLFGVHKPRDVRFSSGWSLSPMPELFTRSGNCFASAVSNGINLLRGEKVLDGSQVEQAFRVGPLRLSNYFGAQVALRRFRGYLGCRYTFNERTNLGEELDKASSEHPVILEVNSSEWNSALGGCRVRTGFGERLKSCLRRSNHAVLVFEHSTGDKGNCYTVFDVNWDRVIEVPRSMLENIRSGVFHLSKKL